MTELYSDEYFMKKALALAMEANTRDEIPVGAIVVANGRIIGKGYNQTELLNDVTAHAEMLAITAASQSLGGKYLKDCTLYVTLEPCPMCAAALHWAQVSRIVIGAPDMKKGYSLFTPQLLHPKTEVTTGLLAQESALLLQDFFQKRRKA